MDQDSSDGAAGRRARDRQERLADLHARLVEQVATLVDGQRWRAWLAFTARFPSYSFNNTVLIWLQRPDATLVSGVRQWNRLGRRVRRGEHGIAILAPVVTRTTTADPGQPVAGFEPEPPPGAEQARPGRAVVAMKIVHVFDVAQTEGAPVDPPTVVHLLRGQAPAGVWEALAGLAGQHGYAVVRGDCGAANGFIEYAKRLITVRPDVDEAQAVKTLAHELGHLLLHSPEAFEDGTSRGCRGEQEVAAESVAFLAAAHTGLDTSGYTFGYVAEWAHHAAATTGRPAYEIVQYCGQRVVRAASLIAGWLDEHLDAPLPTVPAPRCEPQTARTQEAALIEAVAGTVQPSLLDLPGTGPQAGRAFPLLDPTAPAPAGAGTAARPSEQPGGRRDPAR